jgi:hypothetical protein
MLAEEARRLTQLERENARHKKAHCGGGAGKGDALAPRASAKQWDLAEGNF